MDDLDLKLETRTGLPDALRVLLAEYPRSGWTQDKGFDGLIRFWLDRHMMFRKILDHLATATEAAIDGTAEPRKYGQTLARYGGMFVNELHGHHQIEDAHYFPVLAGMDRRLLRGFEILDSDHHLIDPYLQAFADRANAVLRHDPKSGPLTDSAGAMLAEIRQFGRLLERHLEDEEELVVPVILKHGAGGLG